MTEISQLQAGAYRTNITGPLGSHIEANYKEIPAIDILDELFANALVLDDGQATVALVSVDVCSVPTDVADDIRARIERSCGIPASNVLLTATHTHGAPGLGGANEGLYEISPEYVYYFTQQVITAVSMAQRRKQAARLAVGRGENGDFTFNRRLKKPDGTIIMNWMNKALLQDCEPAAPVDPEVLALKVETLAGKPLAFLVNVTNHDNAAPGERITADYSGIMSDVLRRVFGEEVVVLFMPGAAGDINWIDHRDFQQYSPTLYQQIGRSLAGTVLAIEARMRAQPQVHFKVAQRTLEILERPLRAFDFREEPTYPLGEDGIPRFMGFYRLPYDGIDLENQQLATTPVPIHALTIGDEIAIVTNPSEYFVEFGLAIKKRSPFPYTMIFELTNGWAGYVPTRKALDEGGYEARKLPVNGSWLALDAGDQIAEASVALLQQLA